MTTTITTNAKSWFGDSVAIKAADAVPEALALNTYVATQCAVDDGDARRVLVPYIDTDPVAATVKEGAEITAGDPVLDELSFPTVKVGLLHTLSNEAMRAVTEGTATKGSVSASEQLSNSLQRAVTAKLDALMLTTPAPVTGSSDSQPAAAAEYPTAGLAVLGGAVQGGTISSDLSPLLDAIAQITENGANPTAIVVAPTAWAKILKLTAKDGRPLLGGDVQVATALQLFGLPVVINSHMPADGVLVVDSTNVFAAVTDLNVSVDSSAAFKNDSSMIRVTARIGWGVARPKRCAILNVK